MLKKFYTTAIALSLILTLLSACAAMDQDDENFGSPTVEVTSSDETNGGPSRGVWNNGIYRSEFSGINFTLPNGWSAATDEEIANLLGISADILGDDKQWIIESAKLTTIYDMMATDPVTNNNLMIIFENLSLSGSTNISEKDYYEITTTQLETVESLDYTIDEPYTTDINGIAYLTGHCYETNYGISQHYFIRHQGNYMITIIVSIFDGSNINDILKQFE